MLQKRTSLTQLQFKAAKVSARNKEQLTEQEKLEKEERKKRKRGRKKRKKDVSGEEDEESREGDKEEKHVHFSESLGEKSEMTVEVGLAGDGSHDVELGKLDMEVRNVACNTHYIWQQLQAQMSCSTLSVQIRSKVTCLIQTCHFDQCGNVL